MAMKVNSRLAHKKLIVVTQPEQHTIQNQIPNATKIILVYHLLQPRNTAGKRD